MSNTVIEQIPKYDSYKESGVEWLGEIPEHWSLTPNKRIFNLKKKLVGKRSSEYDLLSLTLKGIIKRDMDNPEGKFPAEFDTYQEVSSGDFVFCLFDVEETPRTVGLSKFDGMITGAYTVFNPSEQYSREFLYYFYLNLDTDKKLKPLYKGLRNTISKEVFFSFKAFVPPINEQVKIAKYLDRTTAQIDEAIVIKQKQIELLKECKQIIIQQAVTQGLNPDSPMKDSGVDWIGTIPEHWEAIKLKHLFKETTSRTKTGEETLLSLRMERGLVPHNEVSDKPISAENLIDYKMVEPGQMVMNRMRAAIGIFGIPSQAGLVSPDYAVYNVSQEIVAEFYLLLFKTQIMGTQFRLASKGMGTGSSGFMRLYNENFGNIKVPFAPSVEQKEILEKIEKESSKLNRAIDNLNLSIDKLKEYKTTLINSAVTGKIKVTELA
ncbi:restriction endonuclease subunit S [Pseudoalteromonas rubra]|uniref:Restriction endonuclease subunit S n=1 Tax=Pseudoalteromonas rubra TaxID=43658 RepID=A0A5S3WME3_9GAMM|nr:restriction endonuclease subunit S [Pseudoalteromonas rubra]TMP28224.1 restriction endonuclease subunit S [Pseudoalteromonas rubra]TMP34926.1 restriction endonuclease subunit S [Pseudoalteromonas rubra]